MPELTFLRNEAGEGEGLSDAGIETYRADPFPALARETSQNSRDAHDVDHHPNDPVRLVVERVSVPTSSLPGYEKYREVVALCLAQARAQNKLRELSFFEQASQILAGPEVKVLKIADFNTTGLRGPCVDGSPFHSLVKSSGVSNKADATAGGSFGIGKSAVYTASDLQTVFYSTRYLEADGTERFLCQGKTKFMSFSAPDGSLFRSVGYWGEPAGFMPVDRPREVPNWLRRQDTGTTVCSIAVRDSDNWRREVTISLLMNFFGAIHNRQMEFMVEGSALTANNLRQRFDDPELAATVPVTKNDDFQFARSMYECLTSEDADEHTIAIKGVGSFRLRLLVQDGLPKRLGILRNGMFICDNLTHFGERFARFPGYRDFVATLEPSDRASNTWLRGMESPRHDEFSQERLLTQGERTAASTAGQRLAREVRDIIKAQAKPIPKEVTDLDELSEFFVVDSGGRNHDEGPRDLKTLILGTANPQKTKRTSKQPGADADDESGGLHQQHGNGHATDRTGPGAGEGPESGGTGPSRKRVSLPLSDPRTLMPDPQDARLRQVYFTPLSSGIALLEFEGSGLSEPVPLTTEPRLTRVNCTAGQRHSILVRFVEPYAGPIEVTSMIDDGGSDEA